jgi:hypothetical protein
MRRHMKVANRVRQERQKPNLAGFWVYIGDFVDVDDVGNDPPGTSPSSPPYENGWTYADDPYDFPAFRHGLDGALEFKGHLDSSGASSGTVAFTLPSEWRPTDENGDPKDVSWLTDVFDSGGGSFVVGRVGVDATTGEVTITFPAS